MKLFKNLGMLSIVLFLMISMTGISTLFVGQVAAQSGDNGGTEDYSTAPTEQELTDAFNAMAGSGTESDPYVITNPYQLQSVTQDLDAHYVLGNDIDMSVTQNWNQVSAVTGESLGTGDGSTTVFTTSESPIQSDSVTVYIDGTSEDAANYSVNHETGDITFDSAPATDASLTVDYQPDLYQGFEPIGDKGNKFTGSLDGAGHNIDGLHIDRGDSVGVSLIGSSNGTVKNISVSNVDISGVTEVGGLVGVNTGAVSNSYATGSVNGSSQVGGLVGGNSGGVSNSYATGGVNGSRQVGGLVGYNQGGTVSDSYATGGVDGSSQVGGLVGSNSGGVSDSYATGGVDGRSQVGGLVGDNRGGNTVEDSYWDIGATGQDSDGSDAAVGLTTYEMTETVAEMNMDALDFQSTWSSVTESDADSTGDGYPILQSNDRQAQLEAQSLYTVPTYDLTLEFVYDGEPLEMDVTYDGTTKTGSSVTFSAEDGEYSIGSSDEDIVVAGWPDSTGFLNFDEDSSVTVDGSDVTKTIEIGDRYSMTAEVVEEVDGTETVVEGHEITYKMTGVDENTVTTESDGTLTINAIEGREITFETTNNDGDTISETVSTDSAQTVTLNLSESENVIGDGGDTGSDSERTIGYIVILGAIALMVFLVIYKAMMAKVGSDDDIYDV